MNADYYQQQTRETAIYPGQGDVFGLLYTALGLAGEAGEVANKVKKILRDHGGEMSDDDIAGVMKELGGVHWYAARLADEIGVATSDIMVENLAELRSRMERGTLSGSGDTR